MKRKLKYSFFIIVSLIFPTFLAVRTLGLSSALAGNLYYALNVVGWGVTAATIVSSFGLGGVGAAAIWAYAKKKGFTWFVKW